MVGDVAELDVERAADGREEIDVDERADDREEDLVHQVAGKDSGEGRAGHDRHEHQEHHERPDVRRQYAVHRDRGRVRRDDRPLPHPGVWVGRADNEDPRERREVRLRGLEDDAGDQVAGRDLLDRVPDRRDPVPDRDPEEIADEEEEREPAQPDPDSEKPALDGATFESGLSFGRTECVALADKTAA